MDTSRHSLPGAFPPTRHGGVDAYDAETRGPHRMESSFTKKEEGSPGRIDSWKAIAQYLGRSARTLQRWQRAYGLPVHRLGGDSSSVFAYADELDAWLRSRSAAARDALLEIARPPAPACAPPEDRIRPKGSGLPHISASHQDRSAELVACGYRLWTSLSSANGKMMAQLFRQAIDHHPENAEAYAGLSHALIAQGIMGNLRIPEAYVSAQAALNRALELDPASPEARAAAAWLKMVLQKDWLGARSELEARVRRPSPSPRALLGRALLHIAEGSLQHSSQLLQKLAGEHTLNSCAAAWLCWSRYLEREFRDALDLLEEARCGGHSGPIFDAVEALASLHGEPFALSMRRIQALATDAACPTLLRGILGYGYALHGRVQQAEEILAALAQVRDGKRIADHPYAIALLLTALGRKQDAVPWLEQSFRNGSLWSFAFACDPGLQSLAGEPAYEQFLAQAKYPAGSPLPPRNPAGPAPAGEQQTVRADTLQDR